MAERLTLPHQVARNGARLTYELEDVQSALAADGNMLVYDAASKLWKPRDLVLADLPAIALNDLSDVVITAGANREHLIHNGTNWVDAAPLLDDCSDVTLTAPASGEVLRHNGTAWVDDRVALDDLSDVVITSPAVNHVLAHTGSGWVNGLAPYIVCTSSTRPTAAEGRAIYETDTEQFLIYNGTSWRPPWNLPWGLVAITEDTTGTSYDDDPEVELLSVAATLVQNRRYRIEAYVYPRSGAAAFARTYLREGGTQIQLGGGYVQGSNENSGFTITRHRTAAASGSVTYSLGIEIMTGNTSGAYDAGSDFPGWIAVTDVGPNGTPT